jgi:hypothetical protein
MPLGVFGSVFSFSSTYAKYLTLPTDIVASDYADFPKITHTKTSSSLIDMQSVVDSPPTGIVKNDYLNYDLEHWTQTPQSEQNAPRSSIIQACTISHNGGYRCAVVPDRGFMMHTDSVTKLPLYQTYDYTSVDMLTIQAENFELPSDFSSYVPPVVNWVKSHNPNTKIMIEVGLANPCNTHGMCDINTVVNMIKSDLQTVPQINGAFDMHQISSKCTLCTAGNEDLLLASLRTIPYQ